MKVHFSSASNSSGLTGLARKLKRLVGIRSLKKNPAKIDKDPNPRQIKCSYWLKGTVFKDCPPNSIQSI